MFGKIFKGVELLILMEYEILGNVANYIETGAEVARYGVGYCKEFCDANSEFIKALIPYVGLVGFGGLMLHGVIPAFQEKWLKEIEDGVAERGRSIEDVLSINNKRALRFRRNILAVDPEREDI